MDLSLTMRFVMAYARVETSVSGMNEMRPEHLFLGLLKLAGMTAGNISPTPENSWQIEEDIQKVTQLFRQAGIEPENGREKLRKILFSDKSPGDGEFLIAELLTKVNVITSSRIVLASDVLTALIKEPTPLLMATFTLEKYSPDPGNDNSSSEKQKEEAIKYLSGFSERIRNMKQALFGQVFGQDHAVHAFAEGVFNAEILAEADENRMQPRAIFVFAGPPGVGKTFLAQQAAGYLSVPFRRYDMSSFADHQAHSNLIGFAPSYKEARQGLLTGFVHDHPYSILLFDEIEKAHLNTIQLFLQLLDAGILHDDFLNKTVSFKDTIVIFTTNAGKQLYEGESKIASSGFSGKTILNALRRDVHPQTGDPFFPATICSRLSAGYLIMFNHLHAHDLEKISREELLHSCIMFEKKYRITVDTDPLIPQVLLLSEGGWADARTLKAQTGFFFKKEIFNLLGSRERSVKTVLNKIESIHFSVSIEDASPEVKQLFENQSKPGILLFGSIHINEKLQMLAPDLHLFLSSDIHDALKITAEQDIDMALLGIDNIPDMPLQIQKTRNFFNLLRQRIPEMPVYLLTPEPVDPDHELLPAFIRAGVGGVLTFPEKKTAVFETEIAMIIKHAHRMRIAAGFAAQGKTLSFETAITFSSNKKEVFIHLNGFSINRTVQAEDNRLILDEIEKPKIKFDDVIGLVEAKEELSLFIDYLKKPKKFAVLGLKPPKGILLYGPCGTGKTLLAKAMAGETDATFIPASANTLLSDYQNKGKDAITELFERAQRYSPAIILIDEIEAIGKSGKGLMLSNYEKMAFQILLTEMEKIPVDIKRPVFILATTNFEIKENLWGSETIDAALVSQFNRKIRIGLPTKNDRKHYLRMVLDKRKNHRISEYLIEYLTDHSTNFTLADLEAVLDLSYRIAAKKNISLNDKILGEAFETSRPGEKKYRSDEYWRG
jgi:ATP-dependent Zn protease